MADNFVANPGAGGETFAADDVAGVLYPRSKVGFGSDGIYADVSEASPLPVHLGAQAITGTTPSVTPTVVLMGGIRRDADTNWLGVDDGETAPLLTNRDGRLKVAGAPAQFDPIVGSITANGQTVSGDVSSVSNVVAQVTGTFAGHNVTFEGSLDGGVSWVQIQGCRSNANTIETTSGALGAAPTYAWEFSVNAYTNFRVRATAHTSGTATWRFTLGSYATEPIPAIQTHGISGNVNVVAQGGTNTIGGIRLVHDAGQGASTLHHLVSAATTNATSVKTSAGNINSLVVSNSGASAAYFKLCNTNAAPTPGTTTPVMVVLVPAGGTVPVHCGPFGIRCGTGISYYLCTGMANADATAVAANQMTVHMSYT